MTFWLWFYNCYEISNPDDSLIGKLKLNQTTRIFLVAYYKWAVLLWHRISNKRHNDKLICGSSRTSNKEPQ